MTRKIFRVYFNRASKFEIDVESPDVLEACTSALLFAQSLKYTYKFNDIIKVELISEPITIEDNHG